MSTPSKTTVYLDPADHRRLKAMARAQGRTTASLIREAVALFAAGGIQPPRPASLGAGRSGRGDLSARAEELLDGIGRDE